MIALNAQLVLETAARLFAERGYDGVSVKDIAKASGATSPAIYYHFGSKDGLYEEATTQIYDDIHERATRVLTQHRQPDEKVRAIIDVFYDLFLQDRTFFLLLQRDMIRGMSSNQASVVREQHLYFVSVFQELLTQALGRSTERREAFSLISLLLGYCELTALTADTPSGTANYEADKEYFLDIVKRLFFRA